MDIDYKTKPYIKALLIYRLLVVLLILAFAAAIRLPTVYQPWGGDQGVYGYIADGMLNGKVPYKDMYTSTGYGLYFTYAMFFKLFGNKMIAIHIGDFAVFLFSVLLIYYLTNLLYGMECAVIASLAAALFGSGQAFSGLYEMQGAWGTYWQFAQREAFMMPLITASIILSITADRHKKWYLYFCVGVLIGMAVVFKITAIGMLALLILYIIYTEVLRSEDRDLKHCLFKTASFLFGFLIIQLPFLYYFWKHDALYTMYKAVFVHTSIYAKLSRGYVFENFFTGNSYIMSENLILWLFSLGAIIYMLKRQRTQENCLMIAWAIITVGMIWGQGKFFGYHYLLILGPFSVLTGYGIRALLKTLPSWRDSFFLARRNILQTFLWIILFGNLIVFLGNNYQDYRWHVLYLAKNLSEDQYYEVFNEYPLHLYSFRANKDVVKYLKSNAKPGDSLRTVNGGGDTIIHYLSGLRSPTRFTSTWYLFNKSLYADALTTQLRQEFIKAIKTENPEYILLIYFDLDEFRNEYYGDRYQDVQELMDYIERNYVIEKSFRDRRNLYKKL